MIGRREKTILILWDNYPGFDAEEAAFVEQTYRTEGYWVRRISVKEWTEVQNSLIWHAFMLIVPSSRALPVETRQALQRFLDTAGSILFLNGPLYYDVVDRNAGGEWVATASDTLDAQLKMPQPFIREGISPFYKLFPVSDVEETETAPHQQIFTGKLQIPFHCKGVIPCEAFHGAGFHREGNCRFIPLVDGFSGRNSGDFFVQGRDGGRRGALAFIELENTACPGQQMKVDYGRVCNTLQGSAVAQIGLESIRELPGADELLLSIVRRFSLGLYLFEGGVDGIRYRTGEEVRLGGRFMNTTFAYVPVVCRLEVLCPKKSFLYEKEVMVSPCSNAEFSVTLSETELKAAGMENEKLYPVRVTLWAQGKKVDEINSEFGWEAPVPVNDPAAFVSVQGENFALNGQPWYMAGMNYSPTFSPSREPLDYWFGMFDKHNYDARIVEADLTYIQAIGLNCLPVRVDSNDFHRLVHGLRDFLARCKAHDIRVWFCFNKLTSTKWYNAAAVEDVLSHVFIAGNPTVIALDMEWESGEDHFYDPVISGEFNDDWAEWLTRKFGSVEQAENALSAELQRDLYGFPEQPKTDSLKMQQEYRQFAMDHIDRCWRKLTTHLRPFIPCQLLTCRMGGNPCLPVPAEAKDFMDFSSLELYYPCCELWDCEDDLSSQKFHDNFVGLTVSCTTLQRAESGKPVVWVEFGENLGGRLFVKTVKWDRQSMDYPQEAYRREALCCRYIQEMAEETNAAGTAPWFWCGGLRSTSISDLGYMRPNGLPTPALVQYARFCADKKAHVLSRDDREIYVYEDDANRYLGGREEMIFSKCIPLYQRLHAEGKRLQVVPKK